MKGRVFAAADMVAKGSGKTREEALGRLGVSPQRGVCESFGGECARA